MRKLIAVAAIVAVAALYGACGSSDDGGGGTDTAMAGKATCTPAAGENLLCGTAVATDGVTPLAGAEVQISGTAASTSAGLSTKGVESATNCLADDVGEFVCVVPSVGDQSFVIIANGFSNLIFNTTIVAGANDVGAQAMTASAAQKWVVVPGSFDGVQVLLSQIKGCTLTNATGDPSLARASDECTALGLLVLDPTDTTSDTYVPTFLAGSSLANYQSLFINCDADWSVTAGIDAAIQAFSTNGGHIYFSDLSDSWLTAAFPGNVTFLGNSTNTGTLSSAVPDANLAAVVGTPIDIIFDLPVWTAIDTLDAAGGTTYIEGDLATGTPAAVSSYTGIHPITVGWRATASSGCVFYTSYHVEGASTGAAQELAIKYLVLNIDTVCQ